LVFKLVASTIIAQICTTIGNDAFTAEIYKEDGDAEAAAGYYFAFGAQFHEENWGSNAIKGAKIIMQVKKNRNEEEDLRTWSEVGAKIAGWLKEFPNINYQYNQVAIPSK
jgi:hypothetical protein